MEPTPMGGAFFMREGTATRGRKTFHDAAVARGAGPDLIRQPGLEPLPNALAQTTGGSSTATKFTKGFQRRNASAIQPAAERLQQEAVKSQRAAQAAEIRATRIASCRDRNGNIISHDPVESKSAGTDFGSTRGRKFIDHSVSEVLQKEGRRDILRSSARFFDADAPNASQRASYRTTLLSQGGHQAVKHSSVLGLGRADAVSHGVADNFAYSNYDPEWAQRTQQGTQPATSPLHAAARRAVGSSSTPRSASNGDGERDAFAQRIEERFADTFKYGGKTRAPNRVFDDDASKARLVPAVPDRERQHARIMHEMGSKTRRTGTAAGGGTRNAGAAASARLGASTKRGTSLMAEARLLQAQTQKATLDRDIAMVRALK